MYILNKQDQENQEDQEFFHACRDGHLKVIQRCK